jgi:D-alanyl-D-alanine carboxypeptidase
LVDLKWDYLIDTKNNQKIRKIALENLNKLSKDFYNTFNKKLKIVSAYRNYLYQKRIKDWWCSDIFCAKAWYSEHQSGLAVDLWEASEEKRFKEDEELKTYFDWMKDNATKYGFINTYQKWAEIDWYAVEPWHWRYVWIELSNYLKKDLGAPWGWKLTFAEFYYKNIKK